MDYDDCEALGLMDERRHYTRTAGEWPRAGWERATVRWAVTMRQPSRHIAPGPASRRSRSWRRGVESCFFGQCCLLVYAIGMPSAL